jgi:hypothetical protein
LLTSTNQGIVYDVTGNKAYQPGGAYNGKNNNPIHTRDPTLLPRPSHRLVYLFMPTQRNVLTPKTVFAGKDASRALGKTSTKPEDVSSEWQDLPDKEKGTLNDWVTFFSKRYNVVGRVEGATNFEE